MQISAEFSRNAFCNSGSLTVQRADLEPLTEGGATSAALGLTAAASVLTLYRNQAKIAQITHTVQKAQQERQSENLVYRSRVLLLLVVSAAQRQQV